MNLYSNIFTTFRSRTGLIPLVVLVFFSSSLLGFRPISVSQENVALRGYDTVAYFLEGRAVKGSPANRVEWHGAIWKFHSKTNMRLFRKNPAKYAPAFGGYCALAIADGQTVVCDPEAFFIADGKLYVMKNKEILAIWQKNPKAHMIKARLHWTRLIKDGGKQGIE